jgi:DNA-binding GntR family transcriptional regulator
MTVEAEAPLAVAVRNTLSRAIVERRLPPGWRLGEERLAALFGVSRTPIREALAALASSDLARRDTRGTLRVGSITSDQILHVYAVRRALEGASAALAAEVATARTAVRLTALNRACERATAGGDHDEMAQANLDFHAAIAASTGNEMLIRFIDEVHNWVKRLHTTTLSYPGRAETALEEHSEIIKAIGSRQPELAERLARDHMAVAEEIRIEMLTQMLPDE